MADTGNHLMSRATALANSLRIALFEGRNREFNLLVEPPGDGEWRPLFDPFPFEQMFRRLPFGETVDILHQVLTEAGYSARSMRHQLPPGEFWTIGSVTFNFPIRAIYGGFVEPALRVPIVPRMPENVVAFLLTIEGERDLLEREHHSQIGWHYHYLNFKKARSNLVLCWDTRAARGAIGAHPLFQETHGEGHAYFSARPDLWGATKRKSMHSTCEPDLDVWPLSAFRCASVKANSVWPLSAKLTSIAKAVTPHSKFSAKRGRRVGNEVVCVMDQLRVTVTVQVTETMQSI